MPTDLILNRITDRLRENLATTSSSELLDILTRFALGALHTAGRNELTVAALEEARELIEAVEEAIHTGVGVELVRWGWRVEVKTTGAGNPLVDEVDILRVSGTLSEYHA